MRAETQGFTHVGCAAEIARYARGLAVSTTTQAGVATCQCDEPWQNSRPGLVDGSEVLRSAVGARRYPWMAEVASASDPVPRTARRTPEEMPNHVHRERQPPPPWNHRANGRECPESGVWQVVGTPTATAPIAKGNTMPPYAQRAVTWKLTQ